MTLEQQARAAWRKIRSQLEDRSVLEMGGVDDETIKELEEEQVATIMAALLPPRPSR